MRAIPALVDRAVRRYADRVAVVDGPRRLTFAEVGDRVNRLANALIGLSPHPGSRVALIMANRLEFVEADLAIAAAGKVKAPLNPRLTDEERRYVLANCGADVVITEAGEVDRLEALRADLPDLRYVVSVDGPVGGGGPVGGAGPVGGSTAGAGTVDYGALLAGAAATPPAVDIDPHAPSMILHTSGTTGHPKGATTSQAARIASATNMWLDEFLPTTTDGMVHVAPMSHGSGSKILCFFLRGARNVTLRRFDPTTFFAAVADDGGTSTFVVPTMVRMLLDAPDRPADLALRNITYGGAPMPPALAEEAIAAFGPILTQVYGSCEAPHPVTALSAADHLRGGSLLSSAGYETTGVTVRIAADDGTEQPVGEPGELWVKGAHLMSGYWQDDEATATVFRDGWYRSGDVAVRDPSGAISIVGRERDLLISGGLNVYPAEVEAVLQRHPAIREAAVFGVDDPLWGEAVTAAVVLRPGSSADQDDIVGHCVRHLAGYKKPRRVLFVDELPKGVTGKVAKAELRALAARDHGTQGNGTQGNGAQSGGDGT
ncbi:MAG TPA: AMP-binding protein [Acidimicrobiales bacterium]|nr:AMP-binding protein [Acidimicrobiales bacterium]